jgi:hypothetical protein
VQAVEFSPDGSRLVTSAEFDRHVRIWDWRSKHEPVLLDVDTSSAIRDFTITADGESLVGHVGDTLRIWEWDPNRPPATGPVVWRVRRSARSRPTPRLMAFQVERDGEKHAELSTCEPCEPIGEVVRLARSRVTRQPTAVERATFLR